MWPIFGIAYTCALLPYSIGIVKKRSSYYYVGPCGCASTRIYILPDYGFNCILITGRAYCIKFAYSEFHREISQNKKMFKNFRLKQVLE